MSQGVFSAIFTGPKDQVVALKIKNIVFWFALVTNLFAASLAIAGYFLSSENEKLQDILNPLNLVPIFFNFVLIYFFYKRKTAAAIILLVLAIIDTAAIYFVYDKLPGAISALKLVLYMSGLQALMFINSGGSSAESNNNA